MVRVHMGTKDPCQWALLSRIAKQLAPCRQGFVGFHAGVNHGPTNVVLKTPDIDVIEHEGKRHAHPDHTGRDLNHFPHFRGCLERIDERWLLEPVSLKRGVSHDWWLSQESVTKTIVHAQTRPWPLIHGASNRRHREDR